MSRHWLAALGALCAILGGRPAFAQAVEPLDGPIDILITQDFGEEDEYEDCSAEQEAAIISGEIIVCRRRRDNENRLYSKEEAERRYAEETAFKNDPKTPDFILDCQDQGWPVGCIRMGSVPPPAYIVDFSELPDTPPGSDADRIGQGLAPRGTAAEAPARPRQIELGLPPMPGVEASDDVSPSEEASPEEEPSG